MLFLVLRYIYIYSCWYCLILGVTHMGGDMFQSVPSGDAIFMKVSGNVIHVNNPNYFC